jgi:hypothetical protein
VLLAALSAACSARAVAASPAPDLDQLGRFELVAGDPGIVIGIPHGTADAGTLEAGRIVCARLGAAGVLVTGFWEVATRRRINDNRPTEELIAPDSSVLRLWRSDRAIAANARYVELVKQAASGHVRTFFELHSNHRASLAGSIEASTLGVERRDAARFKTAFEAARDRLEGDAPRLAIHVSPIDRVPYPNYRNATSIASLADRGCAIEHPGRVFENRAWRQRYAECLAEAIRAAPWS